MGAVALVTACDDTPAEPRVGAPATVIIEGNPAMLAVGDSARLAARVVDAAGRRVPAAAVTWTSLDTGIARVDAAGMVRAWEGGLARLVATSGDAADTTSLRVEVLPRSVELNVFRCCVPGDDPLLVGWTIALEAVVRDGRGRALGTPTFTFASSDTSVASAPVVDANSTWGRSVGRRAGTVIFSATLGGLRAERTVQVVANGGPAVAAVAR